MSLEFSLNCFFEKIKVFGNVIGEMFSYYYTSYFSCLSNYYKTVKCKTAIVYIILELLHFKDIILF